MATVTRFSVGFGVVSQVTIPILLLTLCVGMTGQGSRRIPGLKLHRLSQRTLNVRGNELGGVARRGLNRASYFFSVERHVVHRVSDDDSSLTRITLEPPPESAKATVQMMQDIAIDSSGRMFVPAIWHFSPRGGGAGVLVYGPDGRYERTISLTPRTNVRHLALDASGYLFVLGVDPEYFRGQVTTCFLVHKYTLDGRRVSAFSACPLASGERSTSGQRWDDLNFEIDRGSLWVQAGRVYHVLPAAHVIRVFDGLTGTAIDETRLEEPRLSDALDNTRTGAVAWRVLPVGAEDYLVLWSLKTSTGGRTRTLSAHRKDGAILGEDLQPVFQNGVPVIADETGHVSLLSLDPDGTTGFAKAEMQVQ